MTKWSFVTMPFVQLPNSPAFGITPRKFALSRGFHGSTQHMPGNAQRASALNAYFGRRANGILSRRQQILDYNVPAEIMTIFTILSLFFLLTFKFAHRSQISESMFLHQSVCPVGFGDTGFKNYTLVIHSSPNIVSFSVNPHEHLVQVPLPVGINSKLLDSPFTDLCREYRTKSVPPEADRFITDIDTAFMEQVFGISKRKWKSDIHHHRQADDFCAGLEIAKWTAICHLPKPSDRPVRLKRFNSDNAK
jgi:hypothetical protein